jgi:hypothetical protein
MGQLWTWETIQSKFWPKKPVTNVSGRKMVAMIVNFDRQWMELEDLAQDVEVVCSRMSEVEPEEAAACKQALDCSAVEGDDPAALIVNDLAN